MYFDKRVLKGAAFLAVLFIFACLLRIHSLAWFFFILLVYHFSFFRDPKPAEARQNELLSPASGTVVDIVEMTEDRYLKEPALRVGIFLSLFDVHVNRAPMEGEIEYYQYEPGRFLNAMTPEASRENESVWLGFLNRDKKILVRAISGAIARRICCDVSEKQRVTQGQKLGIICYGSRAELFVPKKSFHLTARVGQKVHVGRTVLGEWEKI